MYKTETISVQELVHRMRNMEVGDEIGLAITEQGEYSYGIRRLPDEMFDNGMCWIADYYGGGSTKAFSETEEDFRDFPSILKRQVNDWLRWCNLINDNGSVYVQVKDGTLPDIKWEFKATRIEPKKNRLACVNFEMNRPFHMYISVPPEATDDEIQDAAKKALCQMVTGEFEQKVIDDSEGRDPFIDTEDINWMEVDQDFAGFEDCETDLPVGTVTK